MLRLLRLILAVSATGAMMASVTQAAEHEVKMLNKSGAKFMQFEPAFVKVAPGDTVKFIPTDPAHNAESIPDIWPDGAEKFKGALNKEVVMKFDKDGVYGIKCMPHYAMGMVMLVQVGAPSNLDKAKSFKGPGAAGQNFEELLANVK